jgi:hypothetical protein
MDEQAKQLIKDLMPLIMKKIRINTLRIWLRLWPYPARYNLVKHIKDNSR